MMHRTVAASRSDAGQVRLTGCDIAGLVMAGVMYAIPCDLLGIALDTQPARTRSITCRC